MKFLNLILIFASVICFAQKIEWNYKNKLTANDFKGEIPIINSQEAAGSMITLEYKIISSSIWNGKIKIKIYPTFDTSLSWIEPNSISERLINHEQKHFDIAQIYSEKLQKIVNEKIKNTKEFNTNFKKFYDEIYDEYYKFQSIYDLETEHGKNIEIQKNYDNLIDQMLNNYN